MKLAPAFTIIAVALLIGAGCGSKNTRISEDASQNEGPKKLANTQKSVTITTPNAMPAYSLDEVSAHTAVMNCWIAVHDKVYDITSLLPKYPDKKTLIDQCGKDATPVFDQLSANPDEKTAKALKLVDGYEIGTLAR